MALSSSTVQPNRTPRALWCVALLVVSAVVAPVHGFAQQGDDAPRANALRVYLDCDGYRCERDTYRQEVTFVNWVREPQDAQLHLMITSEHTGGGGDRYTLEFIGREALDGMTDQFSYSSSVTDVQDETLNGLVRTVSLGLVRFAAAAGFEESVLVTAGAQDAAGADEQTAASQETDPWNFWVFNLRGSFDVESEDLQKSTQFDSRVSANRTTELWKLSVSASGDFERSSFELPADGRTVRDDRDRWSTSVYAVRSLGEHLGVGTELSADNSTRLNRDLQIGWGSGIEYNYFPYSESHRRSLTARYIVSVESVQYQETTVFDVVDETLFLHEANVSYDAREPWGSGYVSLGANHYLDDRKAWSFSAYASVRYRLFRGFSINVSGEYETLRDQIYLPRRVLSDEDVLLGRRQLPTEALTEFRIGFSYSFGSIFNNAVNQRFRYGVR